MKTTTCDRLFQKWYRCRTCRGGWSMADGGAFIKIFLKWVGTLVGIAGGDLTLILFLIQTLTIILTLILFPSSLRKIIFIYLSTCSKWILFINTWAIDEPGGNCRQSKNKITQQNARNIGIVKVLLNLTLRCFVKHYQWVLGYVT